MTERWLEVKSAFLAVLARDAAGGAGAVNDVCGGDATLRAEVESLLESHRESSSFLESAPFSFPVFIGPYRVVRELGRGGMGVAYLAERADEHFVKTVAIKTVRSEPDGAGAELFRRERQILAELEHPNIARLLDGGAAGDLQYLVMEFVEGIPLDRFCEEHNLGVHDRLRVFLEVCAAVQYAHQRLVIHCDLKPRNILVTSGGTPKLLDFGIAKLFERGTGRGVTQTRPIFTPEYASPEQFRGERLSTASDIYSLGVTLCRSLTGRLPYPTSEGSAYEMARLICDTEPVAPSTLAQDSALRRVLRGDLDAIILKAIRKEPRQRYATAQELADDVRRQLEGLPVAARRGTLAYRAQKFLRRHWRSVSGYSAAAVLLGALAAHSTHQSRQASQRLQQVRVLATSMVVAADESITRNLAKRRQFMLDTMSHLRSLAAEAKGDREVSREIASALIRVSGQSQHLNDWDGALASATESVRLLELIPNPTLDDQVDLVNTNRAVARCLYRMGRSGAALPFSRRTQQDMERLWDQHSGRMSRSWLLHGAAYERSQLLAATGDTAGAVAVVRRALGFPPNLNEAGAEEQTRFSTAYGYLWFFQVLSGAGDRAAAELSLGRSRRAVELLETMSGLPRPSRASLFSLRSRLHDADGDWQAAFAARREELRLRQEEAASDPSERYSLRTLAECRVRIGELLARSGHNAAALTSFQQGYEALQAHLDDALDIEWIQLAASALEGAARIRLSSGDPERALSTARQAAALMEELAKRDAANVSLAREAAGSRITEGRCLARLGRAGEAAERYRRAQSALESVLARDPADSVARSLLVAARRR